jgi:hypothetical protein
MDHAVQEATAGSRQGTTQPTIDGSVYVKPQELAWEPTQFDGHRQLGICRLSESAMG